MTKTAMAVYIETQRRGLIQSVPRNNWRVQALARFPKTELAKLYRRALRRATTNQENTK